MEIEALFLTLVVGLFFLIGFLIPKLVSNKRKLISFTTALTFIIMLFLILLDLIPEIIEVLEPFQHLKNGFLILVFILLGYFSLKIIDLFVPEHTHEHHEENDNLKEHERHSYHIGLITAISLIIHNILEGISIYIAGTTDLHLGFLMAIMVGCHNLPLGVEIAASMEQNKNISKYITLFFLVISSFLGAFVLFLLKQNLHALLEGMLLSLTVGMLLYISFQELFPEIKKSIQNKEVKMGLIIGLLLSVVLCLL